MHAADHHRVSVIAEGDPECGLSGEIGLGATARLAVAADFGARTVLVSLDVRVVVPVASVAITGTVGIEIGVGVRIDARIGSAAVIGSTLADIGIDIGIRIGVGPRGRRQAVNVAFGCGVNVRIGVCVRVGTLGLILLGRIHFGGFFRIDLRPGDARSKNGRGGEGFGKESKHFSHSSLNRVAAPLRDACDHRDAE
jgi:hypothetical protein